MSKLSFNFVKLGILVFCAVQVLCDKDSGSEDTSYKFVYDTEKVDQLFKNIEKISDQLQKIEARLMVHDTFLSQVVILGHESSKINEKVNKLLELAVKNEKAQENQERILNETRFELSRKSNELKELKKETNFEIVKQQGSQSPDCKEILNILKQDRINAGNLNQTISDVQVSIGRQLQEYQRNGDERWSMIIRKINKIDDDSSAAKVKQDFIDSSLTRLMESEVWQTKLLEYLNQSTCGLRDSVVRVNISNLSKFEDEMKTIIEKSSISYSSCDEAIKYNGRSGVYSLRVENSKFPTFKTFCLKDPNNGPAWIIIQRRQENSSHFIDFNRTWDEYKMGFGDPHHDYWLGLETIFSLTNSGTYKIWVQLINEKGEIGDSFYDDFKISDETNNFKITSLSQIKWGTNLISCLDKPFNTFDRGNKTYVEGDSGAGFWGPCILNYNTQNRDSNNKPKININVYKIHVNYVHLALQPNIF